MSPLQAAGPEVRASASLGGRRMLLGLLVAGALVWLLPLAGLDSVPSTPETAARLVQLFLMAASVGGLLLGITGLLRWRVSDREDQRAAALLLVLLGLVATTKVLSSALGSSGADVVLVGLFLGALVTFFAVVGGLTTAERDDTNAPLLVGSAVALGLLALPSVASAVLGHSWTAGALAGRALLVLGGLGALFAVLILRGHRRPESRANLAPLLGMTVLLVELRLGQAVLGSRGGSAEYSAALLLITIAFGGIALQAEFAAVVQRQRQLLTSALVSLASIEDHRVVEAASVTDLRHDLRAALFAMTSGLEVLLQAGSGAGDAELESLRGALHREATRLLGMLDWERAADSDVGRETPAGTQSGRAEDLEVMEALSPVVLCARAAGLAIDLWPSRVPCPVPPTVAATAARILTTLLDNARKYGTVPVEVAVVAAEDSLSVRVTDSGPGVGEHLLLEIFEAGFRGPATGTVIGSGLGLAIGRELARSLGGDLVASNAPSRGLSVELQLPIARLTRLEPSRDEAHDLSPRDSAEGSEVPWPRETARPLTRGRHRRGAFEESEQHDSSLRGVRGGRGGRLSPLGRDALVIPGGSGVACREDPERAGSALPERRAAS